MTKLLWVMLPLLLAGLGAGLAWVRHRRLPSRRTVHLVSSLLLAYYVLVTSGLGLYWVAQQQLPVFDWHYLFGYATLALVLLHLGLNGPRVWQGLKLLWGRRPSAGHAPGQSRAATGAALAHAPPTGQALRPGLLRPARAGSGAPHQQGADLPGAARGPAWPWRRRQLGLALLAGGAAGYALARWRAGAGAAGQVAGASAGSAPGAAGGAAGAGGAGADAVRRWAAVVAFHHQSSSQRGRWPANPFALSRTGPPPRFKTFPADWPRVALPRQAPAVSAGGLAAIGPLLWHVAGITATVGSLPLRASPSSGALFASEWWLWVRDLPGLAPGWWHYEPETHRLCRRDDLGPMTARSGQPDPSGPADWPADPPLAAAPALLVATAVFARTGHKYGDRCYRYVLADLGHALENLRRAAAHLGLPLQLAADFDEALVARALRLDQAEEGVLALARLDRPAGVGPGGAPAAGEPARPAVAPMPPPPLPSALPAPAPAPVPVPALSVQALRSALAAVNWQPPPLPPPSADPTVRLHEASSLTVRRTAEPAGAAVAAAPGPVPVARAPAPTGLADAAATARPEGLAANPLALIARRRSVRRFRAQGPEAALVLGLLAELQVEQALLGPGVWLDLVASAVPGLPRGAYRWAGGRLTPAGDGPEPAERALRQAARAAALDQDVVGDAALVLVLGTVPAALGAHRPNPARAYRQALLEAGRLGEAAYLAAGARGLGACSVGAFYDDEVCALVGRDPGQHWPLHLVALGWPAAG